MPECSTDEPPVPGPGPGSGAPGCEGPPPVQQPLEPLQPQQPLQLQPQQGPHEPQEAHAAIALQPENGELLLEPQDDIQQQQEMEQDEGQEEEQQQQQEIPLQLLVPPHFLYEQFGCFEVQQPDLPLDPQAQGAFPGLLMIAPAVMQDANNNEAPIPPDMPNRRADSMHSYQAAHAAHAAHAAPESAAASPVSPASVQTISEGDESMAATAAVLPLSHALGGAPSHRESEDGPEDDGVLSEDDQQELEELPLAFQEDEPGPTIGAEVELDSPLRVKIHAILRAHLQGSWCIVHPNDIVMSQVSGGLSNHLYSCSLPAAMEVVAEEPRRVLVRMYGQGSEDGFHRLICESVIFTLLSEAQRGPRLFGLFNGGRVEEYIPARPLNRAQLADPDLSRQIARKVALIHSMQVPVNKEPRWLWDTMAKYLNSIEDYVQRCESTNEENERMILAVRGCNLREELEFLREKLATAQSPVVFCHNDLQEGNILHHPGGEEMDEDRNEDDEDVPMSMPGCSGEADESLRFRQSQTACVHSCPETSRRHSVPGLPGQPGIPSGPRGNCVVCSSLFPPPEPEAKKRRPESIIIIDYEYAAYNYRGFDFANHLCEWTYDYKNENPPYYYDMPDDYPTLDQQVNFVRAYLLKLHRKDPLSEAELEQEINKILFEIKIFTLACHLFWSLWSFFNFSTSTISFDYASFGRARLKAYFDHKEKLKIEARQKRETMFEGSQSLQAGGGVAPSLLYEGMHADEPRGSPDMPN